MVEHAAEQCLLYKHFTQQMQLLDNSVWLSNKISIPPLQSVAQRIFYGQKTAGIVRWLFVGFSPRRCESLHRLRSHLARRSGPTPNLIPIGPYFGISGRKTTTKNRRGDFLNRYSWNSRGLCAAIVPTFVFFKISPTSLCARLRQFISNL